MLNLSVGPDERRLDSTAEWKGVSLHVEVMGSPVQVCLTFLPEPRSCRLAGNAVLDFCRAHRLTDLTENAVLLTSELVGNAVEHAGTPITLTAELRAGRLSVGVRDDNPVRAFRADAEPEMLDERGRGLQVVDAIAAEWGTARHGTGKSVWFRLP